MCRCGGEGGLNGSEEDADDQQVVAGGGKW